ncbi:hypothetical protein KSS87_011976 [Heliosperma pusillum]|nr:hypothetical protein KSS87_011976 [Heliosperma pusillum]
MSDNISFEDIYEEMFNSYVESNDTMNILSNMMSDIEEATSSSNNKSRKKRSYIERGREEGHARIWNDYFSYDPIYTNNQFRRRFRMRKELFLRIVNALENHNSYFENTVDGIGRDKISSIQKCTAAIRMLAYGMAGDAVDDYVRMAGNTAIQCLKKFNICVNDVFGAQYLRKPTAEDIERLLQVGENRGFPSMLGSIDCMHWRWEKCPTAWHGMFTSGHQGKPTMILEAIASYDLWIWHAYFGIAGSNNDINVLDRSLIFDEFLDGRGPNVQFMVNGSQCNMGYYLADEKQNRKAKSIQKMAEGNCEVKVLGAWPSPFVMRPRIALQLKSVEYDFIEETMNPKSELLLKSNPVHKKIPVLLHNDKPICESNVIVQYIDEAFSSGPSILPSDPYDRAVHRFWAAYVDDKWFPAMMAAAKAETPEAKASALEQLKEGTVLLEEAFVKLSNGKPFFGGDKIGYIDIAFGSFLGWVRVSERTNNVKLLDEGSTPSLVAWADKFCADEAVKDVMPDTDKLAEFAKIIMAKNKPPSS